MPTYVLLSHFTADAIVDPPEIVNLDALVKRRVRAECEDVEWIDSYVLLGRYDALDIFRAPDNETASKVAMVIRSFGHVTTEVLPATVWHDFASAIEGMGTAESGNKDRNAAIEDEVDEAMVESFPASDPPSFTPG
ncbi:MAG: GYD domain-containing protein [Caldilineaceae bacterium]|nr:GYD domain-containing protein [Caldilineaceae bacterium]